MQFGLFVHLLYSNINEQCTGKEKTSCGGVSPEKKLVHK